uniref:hypothetical protein n=1 Tax=Pedobacter schmidteae TaxID=2201271 RepID=UPI000EAB7390|nr:hypothetical protein [Pedobacter schmidteae]
MIEKSKTTNGNLSILHIGEFDIYNESDDRTYLRSLINKLFSIGDEVFFFFRREENLTQRTELEILREKIFKKFEDEGKFEYLLKIDQRRFDAIAMIYFDFSTPNFIIDLWKYFYACDFFKPINDLTFDEYRDYLEINGVDDLHGLKQLWNRLSDFLIIKGLGADHLILSYESDLKLDDII